MQTRDGVDIKEGMQIYRDTPEGRIEGLVAATNEVAPHDNMIHVMYEARDASNRENEVVEGDGWWPIDECYSTPK